MSRYRLTIGSKQGLSRVHAACLAAIARLNWTVAGVAETRITCQESMADDTSALNPVRIAVVLAADENDATEVTLHGVSFGYEPLQSARVRERVVQLVAAIDREVGGATLLEPPAARAAVAPLPRPHLEAVTERLPLGPVALAP